ncbi:mitochondrial ribosomal protein S18B isoform X1 [Rhipicephalus microplus]|uniref:mitochondrial ribosomal protein S18B isoform X1 n=1 Tax=Rhipicephalus microplus TaxID=6941 RepID=UPI003F6A95EF
MAALMRRTCWAKSLRVAWSSLPKQLESLRKKSFYVEPSIWTKYVYACSSGLRQSCRGLWTSVCRSAEEHMQSEEAGDDTEKADVEAKVNVKKVTIHPPEISIEYLESKAYRDTYGDDPVWTMYRRNFKGQFPPPKTRRTCIKKGMIATGSPCPICRDEYLVIHHTNTKLLTQFISPHTGETLQPQKTGLCREKQFLLDLALLKAKDLGLISYQVPFRHYDYEDYYPQLRDTKEEVQASLPE